jgi:hypothetical protein
MEQDKIVKTVTHKITEAEDIDKRTAVCGLKYTVEFPGSLYWKDINCIDCLLIKALQK